MLTVENLTVEGVRKELDTLEAAYRDRKRALRALLAVLILEAKPQGTNRPVDADETGP
jgi:hypothetical protein